MATGQGSTQQKQELSLVATKPGDIYSNQDL